MARRLRACDGCGEPAVPGTYLCEVCGMTEERRRDRRREVKQEWLAQSAEEKWSDVYDRLWGDPDQT